MSSRLVRPLLVLALAGIASSLAAAPPTTQKKLIEFGWDEPDPAFMRAHLEEMERTSFDGCVFHVNYKKPAGGSGSFTWECWGTRAFRMEELQPAVDDLKATPFRRFKHHFLRFNTTPAKIDWFDDHAAVLINAELAASVAHDGNCPGLLFDIEQYEGPVFNYRKHTPVKQTDRSPSDTLREQAAA